MQKERFTSLVEHESDHAEWSLFLGRYVRQKIVLDGRAGNIVVQTMTTTAASDVQATLDQLIRLRQAGAEIIRVTAPTMNDARAFAEVMRRFTDPMAQEQLGYTVCPVVADVHFSPQVALEVAQYVDAVRINPGNYLNRHTPKDETEAAQAKQRMYEAIGALVEVCRAKEVVVRIGVNHGSLAPRIVEQYGAGIEGMVASAMEFLQVCRHFHFEKEVVVSLKASEVKLMVFSNRRLVETLRANGFYNKIHLGVTEAGAGEDGRIKSAIGIGALLVDGIGDTIRVSLTEDPAHEIPFAQQIVTHVGRLRKADAAQPRPPLVTTPPIPRERCVPEALHANRRGLLFALHKEKALFSPIELLEYGFQQDRAGEWRHDVGAVDGVLVPAADDVSTIPTALYPYFYQELSPNEYQSLDGKARVVVIEGAEIIAAGGDYASYIRPLTLASAPPSVTSPKQEKPTTIYILKTTLLGLAYQRRLAQEIAENVPQATILFWQAYQDTLSGEALQVAMGVEYGSLLLDDYGNGLVVAGDDLALRREYGLAVLQSLGLRRVHAEFVACPGCGRTLFDLESTFVRVREATAHYRDLKIAVMGCIVNGPGEMGDADYGYVGAGPGRITLYKAGQIARRNIREEDAIPALLELIEAGNTIS